MKTNDELWSIFKENSNIFLTNLKAKKYNIKRLYFDYLKDQLKTQNLVLIGLRQIGKTTLMEQLCVDYMAKETEETNDLVVSIESNKKTKNVIYLNILSIKSVVEDFSTLELTKFIQSESPDLVLIDEIQMIKNWTYFVQQLVDISPNTKFIFSSSNAKALKKELIIGRASFYFIKPLFFDEYKQIWDDEKFENYMISGSYPKAGQDSSYIHYTTVAEPTVIDKIILKDVDEKIDQAKFKLTLKSLTNYVGNEVPVATFMHESEVSRPTRNSYMKVMEEARLIRKIGNFNSGQHNKIYVEDHCMIHFYGDKIKYQNDHIYRSTIIGNIVENIVFNYLDYLFNKKLGLEKIFFFKNGKEIDFIIPDDKILIEVKYRNNIDTEELTRTMNGLLSDKFNDYKKYVITENYSGEVNGWKFIPLDEFINGGYNGL